MPDSSKTVDTGEVTSSVNLTNVLGIRGTAKATVSASGGDEPHSESEVRIYEIETDYYTTVDRGYSGVI
jgi:hypothetical protein